MANQKITELTELTTPVDADILTIVDDISGTPTNKKITYANIQDNLTVTASQVSDFDTEVANNSSVVINTAKETNVSTNLSLGTIDATTMIVASSDGTDATLIEADTDDAGLLGAAKWDEIVANTAKVSNITTNLSLGTITSTTIDVNSSDGTNATLIAADTDDAGLLTAAKFDEIEANTAKVTNATHSGDATGDTELTIANDAVTYAKMQNIVNDERILGRVSGADGIVEELTKTQVLTMINVEDGAEVNNISDVNATDLTDGGDTTLHDHDGISENTAARHSAITLNTSATTGGMSLSTQEISNRAASNAQTGYATAAQITAIETNTGKTTNATHTGDVTGSEALALDKTAITGQGLVTAVGADHVIIADASDTGNLKKALISDFASAGGDMAAEVYDPTTVAGDCFDMDNMVEGTTTKILTNTERTNISNNTSASHTQGTDTTLGTMTQDINMNSLYQIVGLQAPGASGEAIRQTANVTETNLNTLTGGGDTTLHDHDGISENTTHRGSDGKDHSDVVTNNAKVTNVTTNLSAGTRTATTIAVNSSDGTNATLVEADTTNAGILGSDKWDEIVANSLKVSYTKTNVKGHIEHGSTAGTARPTGFTSVEWIGSVEPTNSVNGDTWIDTT